MCQGLCCQAHLPPGFGECFFSAVVGIGDGLAFHPLDMIEHQRKRGTGIARRHGMQIGEILAIESNDVGEANEVVAADLPRPVKRNVDSMPQRFRSGAPVGRFADMPVAGSGRIDHHSKVGTLGGVAKGCFGKG